MNNREDLTLKTQYARVKVHECQLQEAYRGRNRSTNDFADRRHGCQI